MTSRHRNDRRRGWEIVRIRTALFLELRDKWHRPVETTSLPCQCHQYNQPGPQADSKELSISFLIAARVERYHSHFVMPESP